jgi:hypothetical protein
MTNSVRPHEHGCPCDACDRYEADRDIALDDAIQAVARDCEGAELVESLIDGLMYLRQHLEAHPITDRFAAGMVSELMTRAEACASRVDRLVDRELARRARP